VLAALTTSSPRRSHRAHRARRRLTREERAAFVRRLSAAFEAAGLPAVAVPLIVAHSALATGYGRGPTVQRGQNIGILSAGPSWHGEAFEMASPERVGDHYEMRAHRWRAYPSLEASAADLVALLRDAPRYAAAWALLVDGIPEWFAELGLAGFYSEPVAVHFRRYLATLDAVRRFGAL